MALIPARTPKELNLFTLICILLFGPFFAPVSFFPWKSEFFFTLAIVQHEMYSNCRVVGRVEKH